MYYLLEQHKDENGWAPRLPDPNLSYELLASPCRHHHDWSLYRCPELDPEALPPSAAIPRDVIPLLDGATDFPPAMASMRLKVECKGSTLRSCDRQHTRDEFWRCLRTSIREVLETQHERPYFLAEAICDTPMLATGDWHWIIGVTPARDRVHWVSSDSCVYAEDAQHFQFAESAAEALMQSKWNAAPK